MISFSLNPLIRLQNSYRSRRPMLWTLASAYVAAFALFGTLIASVIAYLIPVYTNNTTVVEPGFYLILGLCAAVTAAWLTNLLYPLRWWQNASISSEPPLVAVLLHVSILSLPALSYGTILENRIVALLPSEKDAIAYITLLDTYGDTVSYFNSVLATAKKQTNVNDENNQNKEDSDDVVPQRKELKNFISGFFGNRLIYYFPNPIRQEADDDPTFRPSPDIFFAYKRINNDNSKLIYFYNCKLARNILELPMNITDSDADTQKLDDIEFEQKELFINFKKPGVHGYDIKSILERSGYSSDVVKLVQSIKTSTGSMQFYAVNDKTVEMIRSRLKLSGDEKLSCLVAAPPRVLFLGTDFEKLGKEFAEAYERMIGKIIFKFTKAPNFSRDTALLRAWRIQGAFKKNEVVGDRIESEEISSDIKLVRESDWNLRNILHTQDNDAYNSYYHKTQSFPWVEKWIWFGSRWIIFLYTFIILSISLVILMYRITDEDLFRKGAWNAAMIFTVIGLAILAGWRSVIGQAVAIASVYVIFAAIVFLALFSLFRKQAPHKLQSLTIAVGLSLPLFIFVGIGYVAMNYANPLYRNGVGDYRYALWILGCLLLIILGEGILTIIKRTVLKPR